MIVIIDYGMGNLRSISKALDKLEIEFKISNKIEDIEAATHIILPGVGFYPEAMKNLINLNFVDSLKKEVLINKKPILGLCLGMQLLFKSSEEGGFTEGLGFINGFVKKFDFNNKKLKIPHIGWNNVFGGEFSKIEILKDIQEDSNFYFVHSYHPILNEKIFFALTDYGYGFVSVVQKNNVFGTQFHPEKSQKKGISIIKNFASIRYVKD